MINSIVTIIATLALTLGIHTGDIEKVRYTATTQELTLFELPSVAPIDINNDIWGNIESDRHV